MGETFATNYQSMSDMEPEHTTVSGNNFFVHVAGKTNDAHLEFVEKCKSIGKKQVYSPRESDFLLVFCPVVSRVGTDINVALKSIPGGKPAILVVMHHTFDPERIVADSRRQVNNPNVMLTVDCLFYEGRLLTCNLNHEAWHTVETIPGFYRPEDSTVKEILSKVSGNNFFVHVAGKTNDAHLEFVEKFKSIGKKQVDSPGESDFLLVFCPVVSRVGTDINVALQSIPGGKPAILVVMHHTFDSERIVVESRRQVDNPNVMLTVDCLFYEGRLLTCNLNHEAWHTVETIPGFYRPEDSTVKENLSKGEVGGSWWSWRSLLSWGRQRLDELGVTGGAGGRAGAGGGNGRMNMVESVKGV